MLVYLSRPITQIRGRSRRRTLVKGSHKCTRFGTYPIHNLIPSKSKDQIL
ncbi:hypothetical protein SLEP1_g27767 [Rubroshorea leprosula]|uniref:Ribosomal protein S12 n=1 Tax=Rubroshorea leprosula TaxID=152421 RepID=A0AAV5K0T6_9ROSI|nr:hypothetical protein SLEP1_g27767 [Rubroshorea leprosula]